MTERENIEQLLPWYATGKLNEKERSLVEDYLSNHDNLEAQLALVLEDRDQVISLNEAIPAPSSAGLDRLLAKIDVEDPSAQGLQQSSIFGVLRGLFGESVSPVLKFAAASLVVILVAQSVALTTLITSGGQSPGYETASDAAGASGHDLLVTFSSTANVGEIEALLEEVDATITGGPLPGGTFEVRIGDGSEDNARIAEVIATLRKQSSLVRQVLEAE